MTGLAYRAALPVYRKLRQLKNRALNLLDPPVVVLLYHRVTVLPSDPHALAVSPENFRSQMLFLKRNFPLVRFADDWSGRKEPAVAVTFDDGYADNALEALPVLAEVGVPATFFVSTGTIGTREEFWWDELERLLFGKIAYPAQFLLRDAVFAKGWPTESPDQRRLLHDELHCLFSRKIGPSSREDWLDQLRSWAGLDRSGRESHRPLTPEELKTMAASPWATIGAHTVTHTPLTLLAVEEQRQEIIGSRQQLESLVGREISVFSYPFGTRLDYDQRSLRLCREAGFCKVASNFPGQAHRWTDPCQIPRQLVRNWDLQTFANIMGSFWA